MAIRVKLDRVLLDHRITPTEFADRALFTDPRRAMVGVRLQLGRE
jgi:hypothetical protein